MAKYIPTRKIDKKTVIVANEVVGEGHAKRTLHHEIVVTPMVAFDTDYDVSTWVKEGYIEKDDPSSRGPVDRFGRPRPARPEPKPRVKFVSKARKAAHEAREEAHKSELAVAAPKPIVKKKGGRKGK